MHLLLETRDLPKTRFSGLLNSAQVTSPDTPCLLPRGCPGRDGGVQAQLAFEGPADESNERRAPEDRCRWHTEPLLLLPQLAEFDSPHYDTLRGMLLVPGSFKNDSSHHAAPALSLNFCFSHPMSDGVLVAPSCACWEQLPKGHRVRSGGFWSCC